MAGTWQPVRFSESVTTADEYVVNDEIETASLLSQMLKRVAQITSTPKVSKSKCSRAADTTSGSNSTPTMSTAGAIERRIRAALPPPKPSTSIFAPVRRSRGRHSNAAAKASQIQI
eukprot:CAMPEP_0117478644 /NCGR_PEP_ID=MMETSP0784-20121206/11470_1 /TAXON_ID=39447 /ORGANISM="" /LENGTH=115 /DNA_ID=CAMNT_0005273035 /DNA_START=272 /DNA_END=620 /DNA_ORIENTATION=-